VRVPITAKQAGAFVRGVVPAEPTQWLLLVGSTFLFISNRVAWLSHFDGTSRAAFYWRVYAFPLSLPLLVAGSAGYYVSLMRCKRLVRLLWYWVVFPSAADIAVILLFAFGRFSTAILPAKSVLEQGSDSVWNSFWRTGLNLGTGLQFASAGLILVTIFSVLVLWGRATAPIRVGASSEAISVSPNESSEREHRRTMIFVWAMICLVPLTWVGQGLFFLSIWNHTLLRYLDKTTTTWASESVSAIFLLLFVLLAMGEDGRKDVPRNLRLAPIKYILLAALFPIAVASLWPLLNYAHDRILWASYQWGKFASPSVSTYFRSGTAVLLTYFLIALPEEIAWRGYLQARFVRRYGMLRGIFLVGVAWGAFHFWGDFVAYHSWRHVIIHLGFRVMGTIFLSYPFAWLTMKTRSVLPATVAHAVYNITVAGGVILTMNPWWLKSLLWAGLGYALFRFDPPRGEDAGEMVTEVGLEPVGGADTADTEAG